MKKQKGPDSPTDADAVPHGYGDVGSESGVPVRGDSKTLTAKDSPSEKPLPPAVQEKTGFPVVGLGASAGGLEAYAAFFKAMPENSGMAFVVITHLDPTHVSLLPELLQKSTRMAVIQLQGSVKVRKNHVYVIPPNYDISILNGALHLMEQVKPRGVSLPINYFFSSLAKDQGENAVGIILSGTGSDGTIGLKEIKAEGGMIMVEDEKSAKYSGMPLNAISTNLVDYVLSPSEMPQQLIAYVKHKTHPLVKGIFPVEKLLSGEFSKIFVLLRHHTGHDFSLYKKNTIWRRIERRMHVHQIGKVSDYVRYLQESEREVKVLFKELLIGVTSFFRDPEAYKALRNEVLPGLLQEKPDEYTLRIWVPGCSSGEEAYSIAIILQECMEEMGRHFNVQIFGTDIDEDAVASARVGIYPASISGDVSPERLRKYFRKEDGFYIIKKSIREMLVFAPQNIIKDPPFTKLDMISCRNLLIYLGQELQRKLFPVFHYSLKPGGVLFLGSSETTGQNTDLFRNINKKWKIFVKKSSVSLKQDPLDFKPENYKVKKKEMKTVTENIRELEELSAFQLLEVILKENNTPPCAVIDDSNNIIYIHGKTGRYLEPAVGKASVNIMQMARVGLKAELSEAIHHASVTKKEVLRKGVRVQSEEGYISIDLTVKPIMEQCSIPGLIMVVFEETAPSPKAVGQRKLEKKPVTLGRNVVELQEELKYTRENLQTTIEELETSNEELKSTNEELQSTNEELQSTNEELETSKEELQSLNEEANTVNNELQCRLDELAKVNDDMKNLFDNTQIATIFLDTMLCVKRFTRTVTELIPLAPTDVGRPISHFAFNFFDESLLDDARDVLANLEKKESEVQSKDGRIFLMRMLPYRTTNNVIDGVVIIFENITERKKSEEIINNARSFTENVLNTVRDPFLVLDKDLKVISANDRFFSFFHALREKTINRPVFDLGNKEWDIPPLRKLLLEVLDENSAFEDFEVDHLFPEIGRKVMLLNARRVVNADKENEFILLAFQDVTKERK